jgi:DNA-directed RNA polymerase subunit M/transcription elongation factor TFIIS
MSEIKKTRTQAKKILGKYSKISKNITIIEGKIYSLALLETNEEDINEDNQNKVLSAYLQILYQVCLSFTDGKKVKEIVNILKNGKINYNHEDYELTRNKQKEYDDYLNNPFQLKKGLLPCEKCKSERTMSTFKQDRGGDEGTSVYSQCLDCKHKWRVNN